MPASRNFPDKKASRPHLLISRSFTCVLPPQWEHSRRQVRRSGYYVAPSLGCNLTESPLVTFRPVRASGLPSRPNRGTVPVEISFAMAIVCSSAAASSKRREVETLRRFLALLSARLGTPSAIVVCAFPRDGAAELRAEVGATLVILLRFDAPRVLRFHGVFSSSKFAASVSSSRSSHQPPLSEHATVSVPIFASTQRCAILSLSG
ncbi:hypothetical protein C8Q79DRAFT_301239 [Trametes meyenii]|nr:hypothetical protein C8Q79DRAFT_301239 [Trametes meyenii]